MGSVGSGEVKVLRFRSSLLVCCAVLALDDGVDFFLCCLRILGSRLLCHSPGVLATWGFDNFTGRVFDAERRYIRPGEEALEVCEGNRPGGMV
jgi:hypothetical protein